MKQINWVAVAALAASLGMLQGCTTSVSKLSNDGMSDQIVFPEIEKTAWVKEGTFPNIENLRRIAPGMTKTQLYDLIGPPHFREGLMSVREWDYIFNFRNEDNSVETCQYKIIFAPDMTLRSTHWKPEACAARLTQAPGHTVVERVVEKVPQPLQIRLSSDGMFEFDKYGISDLLPGGVERLNKVAADLLAGGEIEHVTIAGHTDRLGSDEYNMRLSQNRADSIKQYLVRKGIPEDKISSSGSGEAMPLVECKQQKRDAELIRCLQPNRRFEIEATFAGSRTKQ